jgi:hypothetical protein
MKCEKCGSDNISWTLCNDCGHDHLPYPKLKEIENVRKKRKYLLNLYWQDLIPLSKVLPHIKVLDIEKSLENYIKDKRTAEECIGFIDGFEEAVKLLKDSLK